MNTPDISVVMSRYNGEQPLAQTIDSAQEGKLQSTPKFNMINQIFSDNNDTS